MLSYLLLLIVNRFAPVMQTCASAMAVRYTQMRHACASPSLCRIIRRYTYMHHFKQIVTVTPLTWTDEIHALLMCVGIQHTIYQQKGILQPVGIYTVQE